MDHSRIGDLFAEHADDIHKFLVYFTRKRDVEDLVQETFLKALRALPRYRGEASLKTWLISIARSVAIDHCRKAKHEGVVENSFLMQIPDLSTSLEETVELNEFYDRLLSLLTSKHMKLGYREVVICRALMDMSVNDTAKVLGWTSVRVNVTYHRALKLIRDLLGVQGGGVTQDALANRR